MNQTDIIIPVYQSSISSRFSECLSALFKGTKNFNLICVVSDKSQPININEGLDKAKSSVIAILDWDIVVPPRWLKILTDNLNHNPEIGIIGAKMVGIYMGLNSQAPLGISKWPTLAGGCMVFRNLGIRFDENYPSGYWADTDFCRQFKKAGYEIYINGDIEVDHYLETTNSNPKSVTRYMALGEKIYKDKWGESIWD